MFHCVSSACIGKLVTNELHDSDFGRSDDRNDPFSKTVLYSVALSPCILLFFSVQDVGEKLGRIQACCAECPE